MFNSAAQSPIPSISQFLPFATSPPRAFLTERLALLAIEPEDARVLYDAYAADSEVTKYMSFRTAQSVKEVEAFAEGIAAFFDGRESEFRQFCWKIRENATGEIIGSCSLTPVNPYTLSGNYIIGKRHWGKGFATEAWSCLLECAKEQPRVARVEAYFHPDNQASGRIMEKTGMKKIGLIQKAGVCPNISNERQDGILYVWERNSQRHLQTLSGLNL